MGFCASCLTYAVSVLPPISTDLSNSARVFINEYTARVSPFLSFERLECEFSTDTLSGCPTLDDLGVKPTRLEDRIHHIVFLFRRLNYYWDGVGEFPEPPNPPLQLN